MCFNAQFAAGTPLPAQVTATNNSSGVLPTVTPTYPKAFGLAATGTPLGTAATPVPLAAPPGPQPQPLRRGTPAMSGVRTTPSTGPKISSL